MVSVPCRGLIFLNNMSEFDKGYILGFRPLSGTYISQFVREAKKQTQKWFPSPVGDLYFSMNKRNHRYCERRFPSPVGDLYFSMIKTLYNKEEINVSVPCRGLIFLNDC